MQMDEGMDTGPVYTMHVIPIGEATTADDLAVSLGALAAEVVRQDLPRAVAGELTTKPQDHASATMAPMLEKVDGRIDWTKPAREVHDHARGMTSWPGAFTTASGKTLKVLATRVGDREGAKGAPGTIVGANAEAFTVACGAGSVEVLRAQLEGRKPLAARELVAGRAVSVGTVLGS
jgi:methionyl-tRNA formyltransferase